jgi:hypothetical protein
MRMNLTEEERKERNREAQRRYRQKHPEKLREAQRRCYEKNAEKRREARRRAFARTRRDEIELSLIKLTTLLPQSKTETKKGQTNEQ